MSQKKSKFDIADNHFETERCFFRYGNVSNLALEWRPQFFFLNGETFTYTTPTPNYSCNTRTQPKVKKMQSMEHSSNQKDLLRKGSTLISSRTLRACSMSFFFTHCMPKFEKCTVIVSVGISNVQTPRLQPSLPTKLWG